MDEAIRIKNLQLYGDMFKELREEPDWHKWPPRTGAEWLDSLPIEAMGLRESIIPKQIMSGSEFEKWCGENFVYIAVDRGPGS